MITRSNLRRASARFVFMSAAFASVLSGCSSAGGDEVAPQVANPNEGACNDFAVAHNVVVRYQFDGKGSMTKEAFLTAEKAAQDRLDTIGLQAEGELKNRIGVLTAALPAKSRDLGTKYSISTAFNENSQRVARACEAEGFPIQLGKLPSIPSSMN